MRGSVVISFVGFSKPRDFSLDLRVDILEGVAGRGCDQLRGVLEASLLETLYLRVDVLEGQAEDGRQGGDQLRGVLEAALS